MTTNKAMYKTAYDEGLLQDGLTSQKSYVVLSNNGRAGLHLALRPCVFRLTSEVILLGGRLRSAFDFKGEDILKPKKPKFEKLNQKETLKILHTEYPNFTWQTGSKTRCSTTIGILIAAGTGDEAAFEKLWNEFDYVNTLLDAIGSAIEQPITGYKPAKQAKTRCIELLTKNFESVFSSGKVFAKPGANVEEKMLGEISSLVNQTNTRSYQSSLKSFVAKAKKA